MTPSPVWTSPVPDSVYTSKVNLGATLAHTLTLWSQMRSSDICVWSWSPSSKSRCAPFCFQNPRESFLPSGSSVLCSGGLECVPRPTQLGNSQASCVSPSADSTNVAFTISMLLGNLSSCCNPWVYMGFNSHLRPRPLRRLACCGPRPRPCPQLSSDSPSGRHTTLLTCSSGLPTLILSPRLRGGPGSEGSRKGSVQVHGKASTETIAF